SISEKCACRSPKCDDETGDGRADQARAVKDRTIKSDRTADFLSPNEFRNERGERRHFESEGSPEQKRDDDDMPNLDLAAHDQRSNEQRKCDLHDLRCD